MKQLRLTSLFYHSHLVNSVIIDFSASGGDGAGLLQHVLIGEDSGADRANDSTMSREDIASPLPSETAR